MELESKSYDITLYEMGKETCVPLKKISYSPKTYHVLHYVVSGSGKYSLGGNVYELKEGDIFYIPPFSTPHYEANEKDPWTYIWVGFDGKVCKDALKVLNLTSINPVLPKGKTNMKDLFYSMMINYQNTMEFDLVTTGYFYLILGNLVNQAKEARNDKAITVKESNILLAKEFMRNNYQFDISVKDVANSLNLSPNYLANIFAELENSSPKKYLIELRMNKAVELLATKGIKIKDISALCGYPNQLHFSQEFHKRFGMGPKEYRDSLK